jgi:hypothetical protein
MNRQHQLDAGSSIQHWVREAINFFEASYFLEGAGLRGPGFSPRVKETVLAVRAAFAAMAGSGEEPAADSQLGLVAECAVRRGLSTVLCCRRYTPLMAIIRLFAIQSRTPCRKLVEGRLADRDFPPLTRAAGQLAEAKLRILDCREIRSLALHLDLLAPQAAPSMVILDWAPAPWQWGGLQEMAGRHNLKLLFPRSSNGHA